MTFIGAVTIVLSLAVTGLGLTSQVIKNHKSTSVAGLSFPYSALLAVSYSFWTYYGLSNGDMVLIIPMTIGMLVSWVVVAQFYFYRK